MLPIGMELKIANATSQPRSRGSIGMNQSKHRQQTRAASSTAMPIASGRLPTVRVTQLCGRGAHGSLLLSSGMSASFAFRDCCSARI